MKTKLVAASAYTTRSKAKLLTICYQNNSLWI